MVATHGNRNDISKGNGMTETKMNLDTATLVIAASAVDRSRELIADGWVKGALNSGKNSAEVFCVHGALNCAFQELFPQMNPQNGRVNVCAGVGANTSGYGTAEAVATAIMVDEAATQFGYTVDAWKEGAMGLAPFNDDENTTHEQVLSIMKRASERLWAMSLETDVTPEVKSWAPVDEEPAQYQTVNA